MGGFGAEVVPDGARILTHCNAGALATAGYGTALGVIRAAVEKGKRVAVFADETRPFLQGARLTAWELVRDGIDTTVITESMAGPLMRAGEIDLVVVGADRIAANGDTANKIGTYTVAVLAREHKVPFYVAAPLSTIDLATPDGDEIPIEERDQREVTHVGIVAPDAGGRPHPQSGVRRDAAPLHHRHHHRAGHLRAAVQRVAERGLRHHRPRRSEPARDRDLVRRNGGGGRRRDRRRRAALGDPVDVVASQVDIHREWGGVVPELASRQHIRDICGVVEAALAEAGAQTGDLGAVAVTQGPGLVGSLLVGVAFAKASRGRAAFPSCRCITWPATSSRSCSRTASCRCRRSCSSSPAATRASISCPSPATTSSSAARETMRRARRTTRWRSCSASGIRAGR